MSNRNGFILAFGLIALGAASVQADEIARRRSNDDRYGTNGGVYTNDGYHDDDGYYDDDHYYDDDDYRSRDNRGRAGAMNNRLRGMDRNNDGRITRSEWRGNENAFERRDRNGDGVLAGRELRRNNRNRNRDRGDDERIDSLGAIDRNRDGVVSRGEWRGSRGEFDRLDRNRDGYLTSSETRGHAVRY